MTLRPCIIIDLRAQRSESFICVACRRRRRRRRRRVLGF